MHVPPSGPENPALQVHLVKAGLPADELEFDGQELHVELAKAPTAVEYVSGVQSRHVALDDEPLTDEYLPASHAMQSESASLPIVSRYVSGGQSRHHVLDDEPLMTEYLPASQIRAWRTPPSHILASDSHRHSRCSVLRRGL